MRVLQNPTTNSLNLSIRPHDDTALRRCFASKAVALWSNKTLCSCGLSRARSFNKPSARVTAVNGCPSKNSLPWLKESLFTAFTPCLGRTCTLKPPSAAAICNISSSLPTHGTNKQTNDFELETERRRLFVNSIVVKFLVNYWNMS